MGTNHIPDGVHSMDQGIQMNRKVGSHWISETAIHPFRLENGIYTKVIDKISAR